MPKALSVMLLVQSELTDHIYGTDLDSKRQF